MSTTITPTRAALLRRAGTLLLAVALAGAPATSALAEPAPTPTTSSSAAASPSPSPSASADPSTTPSPTGSSAAATPTGPATPTPTDSAAPEEAARTAGLSDAALLAASATSAPETAYAADFIARTLKAGGHHYVYPGSTFFDGGNTIDATIALTASGTGGAEASAALAYLEANLGGYTGTDWGETYVGSTAKALLGVVVAGGDPTSFAGADLVATLQGLEGSTGRFSDDASADYTITISQALAVLALVRAGEAVSTASVDELVAQQCPDGGFRSEIDVQTCVSDPDTTAFAAQALLAAGSTDAAAKALDRLEAVQAGDGSLESSDGIANANTTAVAAQAFAAGGRDTALASAQAFLVSLQYGCSSPSALRGGLAFSADTRSTSTVADSDLRATPQGTLALSGQSLLSVSATDSATAGTTAYPCSSTSTPTTSSGPGSSGEPGSTDGSTDGSTAGSGSDAAGGDGTAGPTGSLAQTGSDLLVPVGLGLLLVVVGGAAVAISRRKGAHA